MLQRTAATACRCVSTSTARPCRHSFPPVPDAAAASPAATARQSYSKSAAPANDVVTHELESRFNYTAPLWTSSAPGGEKWFGALRPGWAGWPCKSPPSHPPLPSPTPGTHAGRPRDSQYALHSAMTPPAASRDAPTPPNAPDVTIDDAMADRIAAYFAARGPRSTLSQFRDEFGDFLAVADKANMPLLKAMVLEDTLIADQTNARQRKRLNMERFASNKLHEGGELHRVMGGGMALPVTPDTRDEPSALRARRRKEGEEQSLSVGAGGLPLPEASLEADPAPIEDASPLEADEAVALLQQFAARLADGGEQTESPDRIAYAWDLFAQRADFGDSPRDLELALSLLLRLAEPPLSPTAPQPNLRLALRVLDTLLEVFADDVVAPSPTRADELPHDARLQIVLLRTAANIAVSDNFLELTTRILEALARLRSAHPAIEHSPETAIDREVLERAIEQSMARLADERHATYRPSVRSSIDTPRPSLLSCAASLLRLAAQWSASNTSDTGTPIVPPKLAPFVTAFVDEAAHWYEWKLLSQHWATWTPRGWVLPRWHVKLARWLAGEAPYSTYASRDQRVAVGRNASSKMTPARSIRDVRTNEFIRFALTTSAQLKQGLVGRDWTTEARNDWLELLCSSSAASAATRRAARQVALAWQASALPSYDRSPFILTGSTLLALVRTALPPFTNGGPRLREQASNLVAAHLSALVSRSSPHRKPDGSIAHFDLTTLSQAYGLLGDSASAAQVLRKLLDQKMVPDRKDVRTVLVGQAIAEPDKAIRLVETTARFGIRVDYATLEAVLRTLLEHVVRQRRAGHVVGPNATAGDATSAALDADRVIVDVVALAAKLGFTSSEVARLRRYAADFLPLQSTPPVHSPTGLSRSISRARTPRVPLLDSPAVALQQLRIARAGGDFRAARRIFRRLVEKLGASDERALVIALETCQAAYTSATIGQQRHEVREAVIELIDLALAPLIAYKEKVVSADEARSPTMVVSRRGLDKVIEWLPKVGDVEAVDTLMDVMREQALLVGQVEHLAPSPEVERKIVRWAVSQVGRADVLGGKGWLAGAARRVLNADKEERIKL